MDQSMRRRPMRTVAALLVVSAAGALGLLQLASAQGQSGGPAMEHAARHDGPPPAGSWSGHPPGMGGMALPLLGPHMARWLDAVGASPEQREQLRRIGDALHQELGAAHDSARTAARDEHERLLDLLAAPQVDAKAVERLRQDGVARREAEGRALSQRTTRALLDAAAVLTAEQRQQLVRQLREQPAGMPPAGRHGARRGASPAEAPASGSQGR